MPATPEPITISGLPNASAGAQQKHLIAEQLRKCLTEDQQGTKAPARFDLALRALSNSDQTARAFLDAGFWAWYAYFLATGRVRDLESTVSQLPPVDLDYVVTDVYNTTVNPTLVERIRKVLYASDRGQSRRNYLASNNVKLPILPEPHHPTSPTGSLSPESVQSLPQETARASLDPVSAGQDTMVPQNTSDIDPFRSRQYTERAGVIDNAFSTFEIDPHRQYAWPKAKNLPFVFPPYMCAAIVKNHDEAAVMLSFLPHPSICTLTLEICAKDVQHIAKELFDVHIQDEDGQRCIFLDNGVTVKLDSHGTLEGSTATFWDKLLGQTVAAALRASPMRLDELSQGVLLSKCLSMVVGTAAGTSARLRFTIDAGFLSAVQEQLWPRIQS